jgi:trehalose 6-phosphate phosphatase
MPPVPARPALFIDIDGTLLPIADDPLDVRTDAMLLGQLKDLHAALGGALAILSGRTLASLDGMLSPLVLPAAGVHGIERRRADGTLVQTHLDSRSLDRARDQLRQLVRHEPRVQLEDKGVALALHYRNAPEIRGRLSAALSRLVVELDYRYHVQPGVAVLELKPSGYDKGTALQAFMSEAPFRDRRPVAIGDDITDLDAFRAAEGAGGMSIAVGERISAQWRLADPPALREWIAHVVDSCIAVRKTGSSQR